VIAELEGVFRSRNLVAPPLRPETVLDGSLGLESLDFAELVVQLERVFGKDPFSQKEIPEVKTIKDLAGLYM
jgi:acyl carrier protein